MVPHMNLPFSLGPLAGLDLVAVAFLLAAWLLLSWLIEHPPAAFPSVSVIMAGFRREWMRQMVTRVPRIFDATVIESLRQGTAFFASACLIAIGGGVALIGNSERLVGLASDLTIQAEGVLIEVKIIAVLAFLANALLKFIWANRLFGYCSVIMAAVPNDPEHPMAHPRAAQAAEINITAARSFNRGLRAIYFALAGLAWLLGPWALIGATVIACVIMLRREFASTSRRVIMDVASGDHAASE